jgi:hypothetical protein
LNVLRNFFWLALLLVTEPELECWCDSGTWPPSELFWHAEAAAAGSESDCAWLDVDNLSTNASETVINHGQTTVPVKRAGVCTLK